MGYIPRIEKLTEEIIATLVEEKFFEDYEIEDFSFARKRISEELTRKFLIDGLEDEYEVFTEDEFDIILKEVAAENILRDLQKKGWVNSYEDENTEETFFLTEQGREELKKPSGGDILNIFLDDNDTKD